MARNAAPLDNPSPPSQPPNEREPNPLYKWWFAAAGLGVGLLDIALLTSLGVTFKIGGHNAAILVGLYFGSSFALLGYLLGWMIVARRSEAQKTALIRVQAEALEAARAKLARSEKLAELGQLAAAIAHEVRNPLAIIRSAAQGLVESAATADEQSRRSCSFILVEIDRLTAVVESLLSFARPIRVELKDVSVAQIFDKAAMLAAPELSARRITLQRQIEPTIPPVRADPDLMSQVIFGLVDNASEALSAGGQITLQAAAQNGKLELSVCDSGPGVPPELRERVFEPFFTTRPQGLGLGLAVAQQIVQAHGGTIVLGERPGGGARFSILLSSGQNERVAG